MLEGRGTLLGAAFGVLVLGVLLYVPGAVVLNALARRRPAPYLFARTSEWVFTAIFTSVLVTGLAGFMLAEVGLFAWWSVLTVVLLVAAFVALFSERPRRSDDMLALLAVPAAYPQRTADRRVSNIHRALLLITLGAAAVLFARPAEMLRGALDSGAYVNAGIALGRTGAIFQRDYLMRILDDDLGEGKELLQGLNPDRYTLDRLRMPAFSVYDKKAALVVPQHYSLYPVWIGLLYTLFGIWGALYATPLLALLFVSAFYFFARRALSPAAGLLALALLVLCPVTIWFARYPVSEVITGMLAFGGFYAFMRMVQLAQERDRRPVVASDSGDAVDLSTVDTARDTWAGFWGVIAGVSLAQMALARPDFIFYLAPVPVYLLYWRLSRSWSRAYTWFAGSLAAVLALYLVHLSIYSYPYTLDLYHNTIINVRRLWRPLLVAMYLGITALVVADRFYPRLRPFWNRAHSWAKGSRWQWAGALILVVGGYALFQYLVAPWLANARFDRSGKPLPQQVTTTLESYIGSPVDLGGRYNLLRIGWYLSPPGMILGLLGFFRWVWNRLDAATGLFLGSLVVTGLVFIPETYTDAHFIYTMRRYLPLILPALTLGIAWACHFLYVRVRPRAAGSLLAGVAVVGLLAFFGYTNRYLWPHVEERGAVAELSELASRFTGKTIVLFSNERDEPYVVATPLQYVFGVQSFALARSYPDLKNDVVQGIIQKWQKMGYKVLVMMGANGGKLDLPGFSLKSEGTWTYDVPEFEQLYYQKPFNVSEASLPWGIYSLEPRGGSVASPTPFTLDIGEGDYRHLVAGFYKQEQDAPGAPFWRWTGDHAVLRVPWPQDAAGTLQAARVTLWLRPETPVLGIPTRRAGPVAVKVAVEDAEIGTITVPAGTGFKSYTLTVPDGIKKRSTAPDGVLLHLRPVTWSSGAVGTSYDQRALGVQVDRIEVTAP